FGFPGTTQEYLTSHAVEELTEDINPARIAIREKKLAIMDEAMQNSDKVRIQYASKYAGVANYWKKWIGENNGLKRLDAVEKKRKQEEEFEAWANRGGRSDKYGDVIPRFAELYKNNKELNQASSVMRETLLRMDFAGLARKVNDYGSKEDLTEQDLKRYTDRFYKDFDADTERKLLAAMLETYQNTVSSTYQPVILEDMLAGHNGDYSKLADALFEESFLDSPNQLYDAIEGKKKKKVRKTLRKDPLISLYNGFANIYTQKIAPDVKKASAELDLLYRKYVAGLREMQKDRRFYPDANGTLRVAYGQVEGYEPSDEVKYLHYTTLDGIMQKEDPGNAEFVLPDKLKELYLAKDYGPYGWNGTVPVCFTASNHTTGGNSGSPIIDAEGRFIGINFDRAWEGTMSDIMFDPDMCRNISVDARYILFIIDKFAGAGHLVKEMTLVGAENTESSAVESVR
ncbi:MAG: S46 family peptidase, partial [Cyclobacteriaceae bacterium]